MRKSTLCWRCNNTCGGCSWTKSFQPVKDWKAIKTIVDENDSFMVMKCPEFKPFKGMACKLDDEISFLFLEYKANFVLRDRLMMGLLVEHSISQTAKIMRISERTIWRRLKEIRQKLKTLEAEDEISSDECDLRD